MYSHKTKYRVHATATVLETGECESKRHYFDTKRDAVAWIEGFAQSWSGYSPKWDEDRTRMTVKSTVRRYVLTLEEYTEAEDELRKIVDDVDDGIAGLVRYLSSSKFAEDTTVQVADVLRFLQPVRSKLAEESWID